MDLELLGVDLEFVYVDLENRGVDLEIRVGWILNFWVWILYPHKGAACGACRVVCIREFVLPSPICLNMLKAFSFWGYP